MPNADQPLSRTRIVKRLSPGQPGTKKLQQRFGDALVCVRYRQDKAQGRRYTTVELLVSAGPMLIGTSARGPTEMVLVHIALRESDLRRAACQRGAQWDPEAKAWRMSRWAATRLKMLDRVVDICLSMDTPTPSR